MQGLYHIFGEEWFDFSATGRASIIASATPPICPPRAVVRTSVMVAECKLFSRYSRNNIYRFGYFENYRL